MELAPYGDLTDFMKKGGALPMTLARTLFKQLLDGVEYLHQSEIGHLDLKPDNVLVGEGLKLKISDFDLSHVKGDKEVRSRGTEGFRAPEVKELAVEDAQAADIYSLGIMLFSLVVGKVPYIENHPVKGYDFHEMVLKEDKNFWSAYGQVAGVDIDSLVDKDFKDLFFLMTKRDAVERATISEIKRSKWFQGATLSEANYKYQMSHIINNGATQI